MALKQDGDPGGIAQSQEFTGYSRLVRRFPGMGFKGFSDALVPVRPVLSSFGGSGA